MEETYFKIITAKTAELFSAATKVGAILSDKGTKEKEALEFYGKNLGLTFQIADDTLDYNSDLKMFGKKIGKDFFEGKITLPVILLFQKILLFYLCIVLYPILQHFQYIYLDSCLRLYHQQQQNA